MTEWLALATVLVAASQQPAAGAVCRPAVKESSAPSRTAAANYYQQGRDSITALYPRHRLLAGRRSGLFGRIEYSILAYQPEPSGPVTISALAVDSDARRSWSIESSCGAGAWASGLIDALTAIGSLPGQKPGVPDTALVEGVRATIAREVDSQLPAVSFDEWLTGLVGTQARTQWEVNDCGEQTGNPALDRGRVFPTCVEVRTELTGGRTLFVSLSAGSQQNRLAGVPGFQFGMVMLPGGRPIEIRRLTDVSAAISRP